MSEPQQTEAPPEEEGTVVEPVDAVEAGYWGKTYDTEDYSVAGVTGGGT